MRAVAANVTALEIANSGDWLSEDQPAAAVAAKHAFLDIKG
jgi:hypothetical protein